MKNSGKTKINVHSTKDFFQFIYGVHKGKFVFSILLVIFRSTILLMPVLITRYIIDEILVSNNTFMLLFATVGLVLVPIFSGAAILLDLKVEKYVLEQIGEIRTNIYDTLQKGSLEEFKQLNKGDILYRITDQINELADYFYFGFTSNVWYIVTVGLGLYLMAEINIKITISIVCLLILQMFFTNILKKYAGSESKKYANAQSLVNNTILDSLNMVQYVKMASTENVEVKRLHKVLKDSENSSVRSLYIVSIMQSVDTIFYAVALFLIYYFGGSAAMENRISVGDLVAFVSIYTWIKPPILLLNYAYILFGKVIIIIRNVLEITFNISESYAGKEEITSIKEVKVKNLYADYRGEMILNNLSFNINMGQKVAIVGKSGTGKSTLANILAKLKKPLSGEVKINGVNISEINNQLFRDKVMYITQDIELREGTIYKNIVYGIDEVNEEEINEAIEVSGLEPLIRCLPEGINTVLGEGGSKLSGGERQRISIARAIIRRPEIFIVDEFTSALDNLTEKEILVRIYRKFDNCIFILFTHKIELCELCDRVIVLDKGIIDGDGMHKELLSKNKTYQVLYFSQHLNELQK